MKKAISISIILLFSLQSYSQEKNDTLGSKWLLGMSFAPTLTFPTFPQLISNSNPNTKSNIWLNLNSAISFDRLNYSVGGYNVFGQVTNGQSIYNYYLLSFSIGPD